MGTMSPYEYAFEQDVAAMSAAQFLRWNPHHTEHEARERIEDAKKKVARANANSLFEVATPAEYCGSCAS